jgi:hypothetical protein
MDVMGDFPTTKKGHAYLVFWLTGSTRCAFLCLVKNTIKGKEANNMLFK